jgi:hypothetical protein
MRRPELLEHGGRGRRVWRRHDRSEHDRDTPGHRWNERADDERYRDDRKHDGAHGQSDHASPVLQKVTQRRVERRVEQHRRDEQREGELRVEHDGGRTGNERETGTGKRNERGIRNAQSLRQRG